MHQYEHFNALCHSKGPFFLQEYFYFKVHFAYDTLKQESDCRTGVFLH